MPYAVYYQKHKEELKKASTRWYYANYERALETRAKYRAANPEKMGEGCRKYREKYPGKIVAHSRAKSIEIKERCEICGGRAELRHHPDYSKPFEVVHLCTSCHYKLHRKAM